MKPDPLRILGWGFPILCMAIACWIVYSQNNAFRTTSLARDQANRDLEDAVRDKRDTDNAPKQRRYAAVPDVPDEEPQFMAFLRTRAMAHNVTLQNWTSQVSEYGKERAAPDQDQKMVAMLKGIRRVSVVLSLTGPYAGLRELIGEFESSDRLYTLSNLTWKRTVDGNVLVVTVGRYVLPKPGADDPNKPK